MNTTTESSDFLFAYQKTEKPKTTCSLSQLAGLIQQTIKQEFSTKKFWVIGEVKDLRYKLEKDFYYFNLVEKDESQNAIVASFPARVWSRSSVKVRNFEKTTGQAFGDGIKVLVECEVSYHALYGLALSVVDVDAGYTLGNLAVLRQKTIQDLVNKVETVFYRNGELWSANKDVRLPAIIQRIALITSMGSDGYRDFYTELTRNVYNYRFDITPYFNPVQGKEAEDKIVRALNNIRFNSDKYDVVVIVRGGGSDSDMLCFDGMDLCTAVSSFPIPVITGIGHDRNESICDLLVRVHSKTPTKAANLIVQHNFQFESALNTLINNAYNHVNRLIDHEKRYISDKAILINRHINQMVIDYRKSIQHAIIPIASSLNSKYSNLNRELQHMYISVARHIQKNIDITKAELKTLDYQIKSINPAEILKKGYVLIKQKGNIVTSSEGIQSKDEIDIVFNDGTKSAIIK